ncbi:carboxypeptidase B isoform X1 [Teleopsis dalmanni]|uniref:carboxypeptidase B isoform X1 n=1 Tax=Teleopsis dalmanni TaxID=139649 RepID=UPI0018CEC360|nr:carboxypeptidase B isoform X1 [Teleopsis dalmanni]XP_037936213.1 carboxypeptidase B isoform X1 [Teleopsis dalmanni]
MIRIRIFVMLGVALICFTVAANAFDVMSLPPIADKNIQTGNRMLYEKEMLENSTQVENLSNDYLMDVNEIPVRFDETQLWRIYNISNDMRNEMPVAETLENKFGGVIWKENSKFLDISIGKEHLKAARSFLIDNQLDSEILNGNIQDLIDMEQLEGAEATQGIAGRRIKKAARSGMNWKDYQDLDVIYAFMREIRGKFPNICRLYTIGKTTEGRDLKVLRISENPREYKKIWIDGGIHAREWISPATVTFILYQLMSNWESQPAAIREKTWYIMPVMNPDGYVYSRTVNRLWRKNRAPSKRSNCLGVDLNRNFDIGWNGFGSSTNPCSDTYRGSKPGSELETDAVVKFLSKRKYNMEAYLTFHSYGQVLVYPWAYKAVKVKDSAELQSVANTAVQRIEEKTGAIYRASVTHEILGIAGGGSDDWSRAALGIKYVYTVELRDRGHFGFVLPPAQILDTAIEGYTVVETVAQAIV